MDYAETILIRVHRKRCSPRGALREKTFITGVPGKKKLETEALREKKLDTGVLREKKLDTAEQHVMSSYCTDAQYWLIVLSLVILALTDDYSAIFSSTPRIESFLAHSARIVRFSAHGARSMLAALATRRLLQRPEKANATVRQPRTKKDPPKWAGPWQCKCNIS